MIHKIFEYIIIDVKCFKDLFYKLNNKVYHYPCVKIFNKKCLLIDKFYYLETRCDINEIPIIKGIHTLVIRGNNEIKEIPDLK